MDERDYKAMNSDTKKLKEPEWIKISMLITFVIALIAWGYFAFQYMIIEMFISNLYMLVSSMGMNINFTKR